MSFRRGDHVVYPKYGVGKVIRSEERPVYGRKQRCLEIRFPSGNRRVFVQEDEFQRAHIRHVMGPSLANRVYKVLKERARYGHLRATRRTATYRSKTSIADPMSLAEVARDLVRHSQRHRLSKIERDLAESAVGLLAEELAVVEDRDPKKVRIKIDRILNR